MEQTFDYIHELLNRQMALRAKIEASPSAGEISFSYGEDYYQEEVRSMGLAMIREGMNDEGEQLILDFTQEHYPDKIDNERLWIQKMMRYLNAITDTLIDNLHAEGYKWLQGNVDMPNEHAIFYPLFDLNADSLQSLELGLNTIVDLSKPEELESLHGWLYYRSEKKC
ncbi:hypothetical protein BWD42_03475 [Sphingobacterium sp. CZ-UAM]|uniref:hypothetical protein n=1 Tax=unclassified Sphingobacterium TaxID=2609468 RepID=UPI00098732C2|nr:hypothetical protein [Sphingobacterium sp. CZ-UAM]OOG19025.1 hypothetical protein BWD42_03475 [Sphingobacterium sp. CZ-UAM]